MDDRPCDHDSLLLTTGNAALALGNNRAHPHGHFPDIVGDVGDFCRSPRILPDVHRSGSKHFPASPAQFDPSSESANHDRRCHHKQDEE